MDDLPCFKAIGPEPAPFALWPTWRQPKANYFLHGETTVEGRVIPRLRGYLPQRFEITRESWMSKREMGQELERFCMHKISLVQNIVDGVQPVGSFADADVKDVGLAEKVDGGQFNRKGFKGSQASKDLPGGNFNRDLQGTGREDGDVYVRTRIAR
jgi:hypothetical protein